MRYWGKDLNQFCHLYNLTWFNERQVELAVAMDFLKGTSPTGGLEVGNVLAHYDVGGHQVVDLHEKPCLLQRHLGWPFLNQHVYDIAGSYDWIVAISTLEHVEEGVDPFGPIKAIEHLRARLAPGGQMLVTVPAGLNDELDNALCDEAVGATRSCTMSRRADPRENKHLGNTWEQDEQPRLLPYGGMSDWADSVWIVEWSR